MILKMSCSEKIVSGWYFLHRKNYVVLRHASSFVIRNILANYEFNLGT